MSHRLRWSNLDVHVSTVYERTWCKSVICKRTSVRAASMERLAVVEAQLGSVDRWPPYVLILMFLLEPNSRVMKKVAAFMYGDNVRQNDAVACYNTCNDL